MPDPEVPTVSVVVPVYNRARTVRPAIDSVLRQTYSDLDVVVVDDCSSDDSVAVVRAIEDPRIRVVVADRNSGAAGARNLGVAYATGSWVAFQDSDDEWLPLKLERQMDLLAERGSGTSAVYCGMLRLGGLSDRVSHRPQMDYVPNEAVNCVDGDILESLLARSLISTQTLVVRREVFDQVGGFDEATTPIEDWDLSLRLARRGPIACVDEPLVLQRFSADSITRLVGKRLASHIRVVEKCSDLYSARPDLLARAYYTIAGGYRAQGDFTSASEFLARARRVQPRRARTWAMSMYVDLRRLLPARRGGR